MNPADPTIARFVGGRYRITGLVASGGMGEVYAAHDTVLDRMVALKVLRSNLGSDPDFVERFRREATNAAQLSHPSIVQVYDWGRDDSDAYMAMEFVDGQNLREIIAAAGQLPPETAARVAARVCAALEHARRAGIVHRDIKPENILVTPEGDVKVADFGLARALAESRATQAGIVLGTAAYLAPEQVQGLEVDHRADLYALGIVLYEMLTGTAPFAADNPAAVAYRRVNEDIPLPSWARPDVPEELDAVVRRAAARWPHDRYATAAEMGLALRDAVPGVAGGGGLGIDVQLRTAIPVQSQETVQLVRRGEVPRLKKRRLALLIALVALIGAIIPIGLKATAKAEVPKLAGKTQDAAIAALRKLGFDPTIVPKNHDKIAPGIVLGTEPPAGTSLRKGAAISVFVSQGPVLLQVPDVRTKKVDAATEELKAKGLVPVVERVFSDKPKDTVVDQEPRPPSVVAKGSRIKLTVSKGAELIVVPDVRTKQEDDAKAALVAAGFTVKILRAQSDTVLEGFAISQSPAGGTKAPKGDEVTITVSTGTPLVPVPDLTCMTRAQAADAAAAAGFKIEFEGPNKRNIVIEQSPRPNSKEHKGSTITAIVGFGSSC